MARFIPAALAALALVPVLAHAAPTYRVTPIKDGPYFMECDALNARGDVAGTAATEFNSVGGYDAAVVSNGRASSFGWSHHQRPAGAAGINVHRVIAGNVASSGAGFDTAATWSPDGRLSILRSPGDSTSSAYGLNDAGDVVGFIARSNTEVHATMWIAGQPTDLAPDGPRSQAFAVNNRRQATGQALDGLDYQAVVFEAGAITWLGTLGGSTSSGTAINDAGHVVGSSAMPGDSGTHAFFHADGVMHDLGAPPGYWSSAVGVNASDVVVGAAFDLVHRGHALVWIAGEMHLLDDLLDPATGEHWRFYRANAINDAGQICADSDGRGAALLTPM